MTTQLHDTGEEWYQTNIESVTYDVGLFNDSTDSLTDSSDLSDITTEPTDGNYSRLTGSNFITLKSDGDWSLVNESQLSFDVTGTTGDVDSYFIVVNFQSEDAGDSSASDHLFATGDLSQSYALSNLDTLNLSQEGIGTSLT